MYERIRHITCTILDEATARREIEAAVCETARAMNVPARAMNVPALGVDQSFTNKMLKLPLEERVKLLRQYGHNIPKKWTRTR
jgi:hypothetical protein